MPAGFQRGHARGMAVRASTRASDALPPPTRTLSSGRHREPIQSTTTRVADHVAPRTVAAVDLLATGVAVAVTAAVGVRGVVRPEERAAASGVS